jgi:hypothetical protein
LKYEGSAADEQGTRANRVLKNVASDGRTRRERAKKRSLLVVYRFATPHFEPLSNAVMPSAVVFQHPAKAHCPFLLYCFTSHATINVIESYSTTRATPISRKYSCMKKTISYLAIVSGLVMSVNLAHAEGEACDENMHSQHHRQMDGKVTRQEYFDAMPLLHRGKNMDTSGKSQSM